MYKRFLSLFLCLVLLCGIFPANVFASDDFPEIPDELNENQQQEELLNNDDQNNNLPDNGINNEVPQENIPGEQNLMDDQYQQNDNNLQDIQNGNDLQNDLPTIDLNLPLPQIDGVQIQNGNQNDLQQNNDVDAVNGENTINEDVQAMKLQSGNPNNLLGNNQNVDVPEGQQYLYKDPQYTKEVFTETGEEIDFVATLTFDKDEKDLFELVDASELYILDGELNEFKFKDDGVYTQEDEKIDSLAEVEEDSICAGKATKPGSYFVIFTATDITKMEKDSGQWARAYRYVSPESDENGMVDYIMYRWSISENSELHKEDKNKILYPVTLYLKKDAVVEYHGEEIDFLSFVTPTAQVDSYKTQPYLICDGSINAYHFIPFDGGVPAAGEITLRYMFPYDAPSVKQQMENEGYTYATKASAPGKYYFVATGYSYLALSEAGTIATPNYALSNSPFMLQEELPAIYQEDISKASLPMRVSADSPNYIYEENHDSEENLVAGQVFKFIVTDYTEILDMPTQTQAEFEYPEDEAINFMDSIEFAEGTKDSFNITDGSEFQDGEGGSLATLMQESGSVFAKTASTDGAYYIVVSPKNPSAQMRDSEDNVFDYVIFEFFVKEQPEIIPERPDAPTQIASVIDFAEEPVSFIDFIDFGEYTEDDFILKNGDEIVINGSNLGAVMTEQGYVFAESAQKAGKYYIGFEAKNADGINLPNGEVYPYAYFQFDVLMDIPDKENGEAGEDTWDKTFGNEDDGLIFHSIKDYAGFIGVKVDGMNLSEAYYESWEGSTYVKIFGDYLDTLALGKHDITLMFGDDHEVIGHFTVVETPAETPEITIGECTIDETVDDPINTTVKVPVTFEKLLEKREYQIEVYVNDNEDGEVITADAETYETEYSVAIPTVYAEGRTVPVKIVLKDKNGEKLAEANSTIAIPAIETEDPVLTTKATVNGSNVATANANTVINDIISYSNLTPETPYELAIEVVVNKDGEKGAQLAASKYSFIPHSANGIIDNINIGVNTEKLAGKDIVVLETLWQDNKIVVYHDDLENPNQTIHISSIKTSLADSNGNKSIASSISTLVDTITYTNFLRNRDYTVSGKLYSEGNLIKEASTTFFADKMNGEVKLNYSVDPAALAGKSAVSVVEVSYNGNLVAWHTDMNSSAQTVYFPVITSTSATNGNGEKVVSASSTASVIDVVNFAGLRPNTSYVLKASIVDAESGEAIALKDGESVSANFFAKEGTTSANVAITFDASAYPGKTLTVYEELYFNGVLISSHKDKDDTAQQVRVPITPAVYNYDITTNKPISGTVIVLKDLTAGTETTVTTDASGIAYSALVNGHKYSYQEKSVKEPYVLNQNTYYFSVSETGSVVKATQVVYNYPTGTAIIRKTDVKTGMPVEGASVTFYHGTTVAATLKTDSLGQVYFDAREFFAESDKETFTFKETSAPSGYYDNPATYTFTMERNGHVEGTTSFVDCPYGTVMITKTDPDGNPLQGARISIYSSSGRVIGQATTNASGHIYFAAPEAGSYYFIEDKAPDGYMRVDQKMVFSIDQYGRVSGTTTFTNSKGSNGKGDNPSNGKGVATGDTKDLVLYIILAVATVLALGCLFVYNKRKKTFEAQKTNEKKDDKKPDESEEIVVDADEKSKQE